MSDSVRPRRSASSPSNSDRKPSFDRDRKPRSDGDRKPRFDRDRDDRKPGGGRDGDRKPRFDRSRDDRKPGGGRDGDRKPRFDRNRDDRKPGGGRDGDRKPRFDRDRDDRKPGGGRDGDRKPRFDRDRDDRKPRGDDRGPRRDGGGGGGFGRDGDRKPRFDRDRDDRKPRGDDRGPRRDGGGGGGFGRDGDRKPRFDRDDRKPGGGRDGERKPRFDRDRDDRKPRGDDRGPRREGGGGGFSRDGDRKPRFDRDRDDRGPRGNRGDRGDRRPSGDRGDRRPSGDRGDRRPSGDRDSRPPRRDHDSGRPFSAPKGEGMDPARRYAIGQILRVIHDKKPLKDQAGNFWESLEPRDQAFAERLIKSTLRQYGQMSKLVRRCLTAPTLDDPRLEPVLAAAACELVILDTPGYAVGSRYVDLVRDWNDGRFKGLVNAVIRRLSENGKDWITKLGPEAALPRWLVKRWQGTYGVEATAKWWPLFQQQAAVDIVVGPNANVDDTYALGQVTEVLPTGQLRLNPDSSRVRGLPGFETGAFWVQDVAAYLPATMFGDVSGKEIWDLCAAPGGKTMQLAAKGAKVTAVDVDAQRLMRLKENMKRVGLSAEVVEADVLRWKPTARPDAILLDAPCSATGTLRHHPDAPWLRDSDWVVSNVPLQAQMIDKSLDLLAEGEELVYAVCSLEPEEGELQIQNLLSRRDDVDLVPLEAEGFAMPQSIRGPGWLRVYPDDIEPRGADGFFAAKLVKRAAGQGKGAEGLNGWVLQTADMATMDDEATEEPKVERKKLSLGK